MTTSAAPAADSASSNISTTATTNSVRSHHHHPVYGELLYDFGYKCVYASCPRTVYDKVPVWQQVGLASVSFCLCSVVRPVVSWYSTSCYVITCHVVSVSSCVSFLLQCVCVGVVSNSNEFFALKDQKRSQKQWGNRTLVFQGYAPRTCQYSLSTVEG